MLDLHQGGGRHRSGVQGRVQSLHRGSRIGLPLAASEEALQPAVKWWTGRLLTAYAGTCQLGRWCEGVLKSGARCTRHELFLAILLESAMLTLCGSCRLLQTFPLGRASPEADMAANNIAAKAGLQERQVSRESCNAASQGCLASCFRSKPRAHAEGCCRLRLGLLVQIMFMAYGREVSPDTADLAAELLGFNPEQVLPMLSQPAAG